MDYLSVPKAVLFLGTVLLSIDLQPHKIYGSGITCPSLVSRNPLLGAISEISNID